MIFLSAQTFEDMINFLGWSYSYGMFATICILGTVFIITIIPETKGKNAEAIELHYGRSSTVRRVSLRLSLVNRGIPDTPAPAEASHTGSWIGVDNSTFQADEKI